MIDVKTGVDGVAVHNHQVVSADFPQDELSHAYERLDHEIAKIEKDIQHAVESIEVKNFLVARKKLMHFSNIMMKNNEHTQTHNKIATTSSNSACIVTASGIKSFDGLDDCTTYISSDEEMEEHLLDEGAYCHFQDLKPTFFVTAPIGVNSSGSSGHIYHPRKIRRAYYDMDDDEYIKAYCTGRDSNNFHQTKLAHNHQMKIGQVGMESTPLTVLQQSQASQRKTYAEEQTKSIIYSSVTRASTTASTTNPPIRNYLNEQSIRVEKDKTQSRINIGTRDTKDNYINHEQSKAITKRSSVSSKVNESFDSTSSLEMSRIFNNEKDLGSTCFHQSYSILDYSEDSISTPAISNKTRSRLKPCSDYISRDDSPTIISSTNTGKREPNSSESYTYAEKSNAQREWKRLSTSTSSSSSVSLDKHCNRIKFMYRPSNALSASNIGASTTSSSHYRDGMRKDDDDTCSSNNAWNEEERIFQQIRCKEKWLDERDRRFQSISFINYHDPNPSWKGTSVTHHGKDKLRNNESLITASCMKKNNNAKKEDDVFPFDEIE